MKNRLSQWINRDTPLMRWGVLLVVIAVMVLRKPEFLYYPRFWAEEGRDYFAFAYNNPFWKNYLYPQFGYYTLYNSLATSLAVLFPLEVAPLVTTYCAFAVQAATSAFVLWSRNSLLDTMPKKIVMALSIQLSSYCAIWLSTIGVQYFLCVITYMILLHDTADYSRRRDILYRVMLTLNGLTGVLSCFMTPVFLLKAIRTRSRQFALYTAILAVSSVIQCAVFLYALVKNDFGMGLRFVRNDPFTLLFKVVSLQFAAPFFGHVWIFMRGVLAIGYRINEFIFTTFGFNPFTGDSEVMDTIVATLVIAILAVCLTKVFQHREIRDTFVAFWLVAIFSTLFSVNMSSGPRYVYAPSMMLMTIIVYLWGNRTIPRWINRVALFFIVMNFAVNSFEYRYSIDLSTYKPHEWPAWRDEVAKWRKYNNYQLVIWPSNWRMSLDKTAR